MAALISKQKEVERPEEDSTAMTAKEAQITIIFQPRQSISSTDTQFSLYGIDDHMFKEIPIAVPTRRVACSYHCKEEECIHDLSLLASCDALLLFLQSHDKTYHVLNIATEEWLAVPEPRGRPSLLFSESIAAFYFNRSTGEYRLLSIYRAPRLFGFEVLSLGRESTTWRRIFDCDEFSDSASSYASNITDDLRHMRIDEQVVVHGQVHWPTFSDSWLIAFDVESEEFRRILLPQQRRSGVYDCQLIDMRGSLGLGLFQKYSHAVMELWLMKDYAKEEWVKQHTILTDDFIRPPLNVHARTFRSLALWNNDDEILVKWSNDICFLYNLKSKRSRYMTPIDFYKRQCHCQRPHCYPRKSYCDSEFHVALSTETLRGHKIEYKHSPRFSMESVPNATL